MPITQWENIYSKYSKIIFIIEIFKRGEGQVTKTSTDVLIVGGSAAGLSVANSTCVWYPDKKVTVVRNVPYTVVPCGIPYIYGTLNSVVKDKIPDEGYLDKGVNFIIGTVIDVDRNNKTAKLSDGSEISYEKLVIGTGSKPVMPPIKGINLKNVFPIEKDPDFLENLGATLEGIKDIVVIGGGFIGVEMAEQIKLKGDYNVTLLEALPRCLLAACEEEAGLKIEEQLEKLGVKVSTNKMAKSIVGTDKVEGVELATGEMLEADMVVLGIGAAPNVDLAEKIGLEVDKKMGIVVDEYMRTIDKDIFACGDCCTKFSIITGKPSAIRLASVATSEGLIVGSNLYSLNRKTRGAVGAFATRVGEVAVAAAGFTEKMANDNGCDYYLGEITAPDRHPGSLPGCTMETKVKLLFNKKNDRLIGGHVIGGFQAADMVNILALAIQQQVTADELAISQYATHPLLTGSPLVYQIMWAAENAIINKKK
jgi:NADPH-dependent 2,4-dienoyl-CoA reductase/sulfur reductase-like enzyme